MGEPRPGMVELRVGMVEPKVDGRLRASWRRSEHYGVSLERVEPTFTGDLDTGSLLYECGQRVLAGLQASLANEPVSLMVADSQGLVLARLCSDSGIADSLDRVHLGPGFFYAERNAGTNGLGLSLADRTPSLVRADEHYCTALQGYTCAAAPVFDPRTGDLAGSINLTTWSDASSGLLLALAQAAADHTSALMLVRSGGHRTGAGPPSGRTGLPSGLLSGLPSGLLSGPTSGMAARGEVFRVQPSRLPGEADDPCTSSAWRSAVREAATAMAAGRVLAVVGEPGAGKQALVARARRSVVRRERLLSARTPPPDEVDAWLELWTPELGEDTCVIVSGLAGLPAWAAGDLARAFDAARRRDGRPQPFVITAEEFEGLPEPIGALVDAVVEVPPLRDRGEDVLPLAGHFAQTQRHRDVGFTRRAGEALTAYQWPQNVRQLRRVVRDAASRADVVDLRHLPPEVFGDGHRLSRLEVLERDEIVRALTEPGTTAVRAAGELGLSRATLYRKIDRYGISVPGRAPSRPDAAGSPLPPSPSSPTSPSPSSPSPPSPSSPTSPSPSPSSQSPPSSQTSSSPSGRKGRKTPEAHRPERQPKQ